jgi:hypothetical protein
VGRRPPPLIQALRTLQLYRASLERASHPIVKGEMLSVVSEVPLRPAPVALSADGLVKIDIMVGL